MTAERNARSGEVARAIGLSAASVQAYARDKKIPHRTTPGGQYRYNIEEVVSVLGPPAIEVREDLVDLDTATSRVIMGALSAYRGDQADEVTLSRLRSRGHRQHRASAPAAAIATTDGLVELDEMIARAGGAALAVLHR
jgi:GTP:adenosylcobinamide-phosphate guanylyltransferase